MNRTTERLIDLGATIALLLFAYLVRESAPELMGAVVVASIGLWLKKNAESPDSPAHREAAAALERAAALVEATAIAAAKVIQTADKVTANARESKPIVPGE